MTTRAAIYVRQSVKKDIGIQQQLLACRALAADRGWTVVEEFDDNDVGATNPRGPQTAWGRLLRGLDAGEFEMIIA